MSTPENPFAGAEPPILNSPAEGEVRPGVPANVADAGVSERFPIWTLGDIGRIVLILVLAIFFSSVLVFAIAAVLPAFRHLKPEQVATDARLIVPAQGFAYLVTLWFIYRMIARHYHMKFLDAIHWRWPSNAWPLYLGGGVALSVGIQLLSSFLPIPKQLPMDQFFSTATGAWIMAVFGTLVAPATEELFFRGLLFPSLASKLGLVASVGLTSSAFALVHASQLGRAWAPVFVLLLVGIALTMVRVRTHSVAAATLVHVGYNGTIFVIMIIVTRGFTQMDRIAR